MKKIISLILSIVMLMSFATIVNADEAAVPEKVEISFKVGDSTLMINGNPTTVETPYVVGAGTTLVPLRVITEAFGAKVTWVNETKEIILEYPDVNIKLQIGNVSATVNDHTETLPEAPVLSPNGVTMVPLRFISETFGATVGYDNATAAITVVKEAATESDKISQSTDLPKIGDSYWNWSMMRPSAMMMTDRLSDGCYTIFEDENDAKLSINIFDVSDYEGSAIEDRFNELKTGFSGFTFSKAEKSKDAFGNECFRIIARDKEDYVDIYGIYKNDYCYQIAFTSEKDSEMIASATAILESFKLEFAANDEEKAQTHDLSNVGEDGYRLVNNEDLGVSFKVPATCVDVDPDQLNLIWFAGNKEDDVTEITVGLYSKTEEVTAKTLAQDDCDHHKKYFNAEVCSVSNLTPYKSTECGENACYYWVTTDGLFSGDYELYDIYFEKGDYVYNVTVTVPRNQKEVYQLVMESLKIEEIDSEKTGVFLRNSIEKTSKVSSCSDWTIQLTSWWDEYVKPSSSGAIWSNKRTGAALQLSIADAGEIKKSDMKELVGEFSKDAKGDGKIVKKVEQVDIGTRRYYTFQVYKESEELNVGMYSTYYIILMNGDIYVFTLAESQERANSQTAADVMEHMATFELK